MSPRLRITVTAVLWSTGGAAIKWCGFAGWQLAGFRAGVACLTLLALIPEARRGWTGRTAVVGVGYAATTLLYVQANKLTTAANAIFLQNTSPLFIVALAPLLLGEHVTRRDVVHMALMGLGLVLFFTAAPTAFATAPNPRLGNGLAVTCAATWSLTLVGYRWVARGGGPAGAPVARAVVCGNLIACAVALIVAYPFEPGRAADWAAIGYLGVFQLGVAYFFFIRAVPHIRALEVSLLLLLEPVLSPVWAWLIHGETPGPMELVGATLILTTMVLRAWRDARSPAAAPATGA